MGRQEDMGSANSEIFFMLKAARYLDRNYSVWGRIISGMDVLQAIAPGEPPRQPDVMTSVHVLSDLPPESRPHVFLPTRQDMKSLIDQTRLAKGADFSICDVPVPARVAP
jgi:peptidylprolyl isomerase